MMMVIQGAAFYWWTHAINELSTYEGLASSSHLIASSTYPCALGLVANCNFSFIGPLDANAVGVNNELCNKYCDLAFEQMGNVNIYDIYVCLPVY